MATKCDAWRAATDNTLHASEKDATTHDLRVLSNRLTHPNSTHLAANLAKNADEAIRLLQAYAKAHPGAGGGKVPSKAQKGPAAAKPAPDEIMLCCRRTFAECDCDDPGGVCQHLSETRSYAGDGTAILTCYECGRNRLDPNTPAHPSDPDEGHLR